MFRIQLPSIPSLLRLLPCVTAAILCAATPALAETCRAADGGAIACGETVTGSISPAGDTDSYTFTPAAAGVVHIRIVAHDAFNPMCYRLHDPGGAPIGSLQCGDAGFTIGAGTHTIVAQAQSAGGTGSYGLALQGLSSAITCGGAMECGQPAGGAIDCKGDSDALTFGAQAGDDIALRVAPSVTMCFRLYGPTGSLIGSQTCDFGNVTIPSAGVHTLLITPSSPGTTAAYGITRQGVAGSGTCAEPIACGATVAGQINPLGDVNAHSFEAAAPGGATVRIGPASIIASMCFRLYDPSGAPMGGRSCDTQAYAMGAGRHTLLVEPSSSSSTGGYGFTLEGASESLQCGQMIACGTSLQGSIEQLGDTDAYAFWGLQGDNATIAINGSLTIQMCYRLYSPSGAALGGRVCNTSTQWPLASSGVHTIVVEPYNISLTSGNYTLNLQCNSCVDGDGDGVCLPPDNCPGVANASQADSDGDRFGDACDCAPSDAGAWGWPVEVPRVTFAADTVTLTWDDVNADAGPGTVSDVLRGSLGRLPPGSGGPETCVAGGVAGSSSTDLQTPSPGAGFWYLVRDRNGCGAGPWGAGSSGTPYTSTACP